MNSPPLDADGDLLRPFDHDFPTGGAIQMAAHKAAAELGWDEASQKEYEAFLAGWWAHWRWANPRSEVMRPRPIAGMHAPSMDELKAAFPPGPSQPEEEQSRQIGEPETVTVQIVRTTSRTGGFTSQAAADAEAGAA